MPRIRLHLEDDQGNPILASRTTYQLEGGCETLEEIERAVESFKRQALPQIEHSLLEEWPASGTMQHPAYHLLRILLPGS